MSKLNSERVYLYTGATGYSSVFTGELNQCSKHYFFAIAQSSGSMNISSDELFQKLKNLVISTAEEPRH